MASSDEDNQPPQVVPDEKEDESARLEGIWAMFNTGARIQMSTHAVACLVMTLSVTIVNNSTSVGVLNYQKVKDALEAARVKCTKRFDPELNDRETSAMELLEKLESFDKVKSNKMSQVLKTEIVKKTKQVMEKREEREQAMAPWKIHSLVIDKRWTIHKSPLFTEVAAQISNTASPLLLLQGDDLTDVLQRLKVAAVHEICVSLEVGWALFHNSKNCGYLFCDIHKCWKRYVTAQGPLTAYQVMEYLSNERHYNAHCRALPEDTETSEHHEIKIFLDQYAALIQIMKPYFDRSFQVETLPLEEKKHLQYLFPGIIENQVDIGWRLAECYPNLVAIINDRSELREKNRDLDQQVTDLKKGKQEMNRDLLSIIQCHSESDSENLRDLKKLLGLLPASPQAVDTPAEAA